MRWGWNQQSDWWLSACGTRLMPVGFVLGLVFVATGIGAVVDGNSAQPLATGVFIVVISAVQWVRAGAEIARREQDLRTRSEEPSTRRKPLACDPSGVTDSVPRVERRWLKAFAVAPASAGHSKLEVPTVVDGMSLVGRDTAQTVVCAPFALGVAPGVVVAGFDVHRRQITFDALDTVTGESWRGYASG